MINLINTVIGVPLGYLMRWCWQLIGNYGLAIILFTLLTKVILFPLSLWVQSNSIRMIKIKPQLNMLEVSMAGDKDKLAQEQMALYKAAGYKPLAGIVPTLIQIPIILGLISVVYHPLQHLLHLDAGLIGAFTEEAARILNNPNLGAGAQMNVIRLVNDPAHAQAFSSLGAGASQAVAAIQSMDLGFCGLDLSQTPTLRTADVYWLMPVFSAASAFLLSFLQNKANVLQREAGFWGQWGMAIFLTLFSLYFAFIVPAGAGLYWIMSNLSAILVMYIVNFIMPPQKYIDYAALEESKAALAKTHAAEKKNKPTGEQRARAKADYKRFGAAKDKRLVFYSERSGFYKYFKGVIENLLRDSDLVIHYVTSDPNDAVFQKDEPRLIPYYIDDNRLIVLFMEMDADMVVMTMPDLQQMYIKRSYVRKDTEYVYMFHYPLSTTMVLRKGALDCYDTIFCVGDFQFDEIRQTEALYGLPPKNLIACGYALLEELHAHYAAMEKTVRARKKVLIAPSWQADNILDSCIDGLLEQLLGEGFAVVVRPHPEYVKRYGARMQAIVDRYRTYAGDDLSFELDFSSSDSIYDSDVVISDWSGTAYEFAFVTNKPVVFIDTPQKINNPEYDRIEAKPLEIALRDKIGVRFDPMALNGLARSIRELMEAGEAYAQTIRQLRETYIANFGSSGEVGAKYIIDRLEKK
ncbi:MAG: membrane protein insertase YidC [Clostridia bacterium]|nr:membrane protein insertase YidC [Clostridia bacterium]